MDGFFNLDDINILGNYLAGIIDELTPEQEKLADVNFDGKISAMDKLIMREWVEGYGKYSKDIYSNKVYTYTDLEDGVIFKDDIIKAGESATYFLWLYLDESTPNDVQNTFFVGNIDVEGEYILNIPDPVNFSTDSWKTIVKAVQENNTSKYNVGDTKTVDMGTYGTHTLRIANTSTPSECSGTGFSQTACGFVLEFADIITIHAMKDTNTNVEGWPATSMRTFVNNDIYNAIPSEIKNAIIDTKVVSEHGPNDTANFTSTDKLYLLSTAEVWAQGSSNTINNDTARDNTRQLDYYKNLGVTTSNKSGAIKKNGTNADFWWLRAAFSYDSYSFYRVSNDGDWSSYNANYSYGVAPAFRIG